MDTRKTPATKAPDTAAPWKVSGGICAFPIPKLSLPQKKSFYHRLSCIACCSPKTKSKQEINLLLSKVSLWCRLCLHVKDKVKINIIVKYNTNVRWKMTHSIHHTSRCQNKNAALCWRKKCQLTMYNILKSDHFCCNKCQKRGTLFQAS